jgi:GTP 3',8-cyclase
VRFIEYMPFGDNHWQPELLVGWHEMAGRIGERFQLLEAGRQGVARLFRVEGHRGMVGFIAPLMGCFCETCSRLRLTADGRLRLCLHDRSELDLAVMLRSGATDRQISDALKAALAAKGQGHGRTVSGRANGPAVACMSSIGG